MPPTSGICVAGVAQGCAQAAKSVQMHDFQIWTGLLLPNVGCGRGNPHLSTPLCPRRAVQGSHVWCLRGVWKVLKWRVQGLYKLDVAKKTAQAGCEETRDPRSAVAMFTHPDYRSFMLRSKVQRLSCHFCMQVWSSVAYSVGLIHQHYVWHITSKKWLKSLRDFPVLLVPRQRCTMEIMPLFLLGRASLPCLSSYFTSCSQKLHFSSTKVQSLFNPCSDHSHLPHQVLLQCIDWYLYIWKQIFA